jgi:hypothetical protein
MKERFRNSGYRKTEIDGDFENERKVTTGLADFAWQYIKPITVDELDINQQLFFNALKPKDRAYIRGVFVVGGDVRRYDGSVSDGKQ